MEVPKILSAGDADMVSVEVPKESHPPVLWKVESATPLKAEPSLYWNCPLVPAGVALPPVMVPHVILPDASVVSARVLLQAPNRPSVVVPIFDTLNKVVVALAVEEPMAKRGIVVSPLLACTESFAYGDDVPMPSAPEEGSAKAEAEVVAGRVPNRRFPILS